MDTVNCKAINFAGPMGKFSKGRGGRNNKNLLLIRIILLVLENGCAGVYLRKKKNECGVSDSRSGPQGSLRVAKEKKKIRHHPSIMSDWTFSF